VPLKLTPAAVGVRRKCACRNCETSQCAQCRAKRLQRSRDRAAAPSARSGTEAIVRTPGTPLDGETRAFMEPRFGHDFSGVRVHADAEAASSARAWTAAAYTVGSHIVFGAGRYAPGSPAGRKLLAHELAHVVQQSGGGGATAVQRAAIGVTPGKRDGDDKHDPLEREADQAAQTVADGDHARPALNSAVGVQRQRLGSHPAIVGLDEAGPHADLTGGKEDALMACTRGAKPNPPDCAPPKTLTWASFAGSPRRSSFGAETASDVRVLPMDPIFVGCVQRILGWSADQTRVFQGFQVSSRSWVKAQFKDPTDLRVNGCQGVVRDCERFYATHPNGGSFSLGTQPDPTCPASAPPQAATASDRAGCGAVLAPACTAAAVVESKRLLNHEQHHFDLSCAIAHSANNILLAGRRPLTLDEVRTALQTTQAAYDNDTAHGCNPAQQARWEGEIARGLPDVVFPKLATQPARPARRPRRRP
jgi:hypothetical protein